MKKIIILNIIIVLGAAANAQDFKANVTTAKTSYASGKLEDAHFALQQMLSDIDIIIGKEVMKLLPTQMEDRKVNASEDNVTGNVSFVGATIHRTYGATDKKAELDIINNSPLLGTLNALISAPLMGMFNDGKTKILKVQGYKARLSKEEETEGGKPTYKLEMPFSNALITFKVSNTSESEIIAMMNTLPLDKISKLIQ
jgi:hypothetical protein